MKVLLAVELGTAAEPLAAALKLLDRPEVLVLHATEPGSGFIGYASDVPLDREKLADKYEQEHARVLALAAALRTEGIDATGCMVEGEPVDAVLREAKKHQAEVIVVGSHHHGPLFNLLLGSESANIQRRAEVPVLVVPLGPEE